MHCIHQMSANFQRPDIHLHETEKIYEENHGEEDDIDYYDYDVMF